MKHHNFPAVIYQTFSSNSNNENHKIFEQFNCWNLTLVLSAGITDYARMQTFVSTPVELTVNLGLVRISSSKHLVNAWKYNK